MGMKSKTIRMILCRKWDHWLQSLPDGAQREFLRDKGIITGGCIASMLLGESIHDFDFYFTNKEAAEMVARIYVEQFTKAPTASFARTWSTNSIQVVVNDDRVTIKVKSAGVASEDPTSDYQYFEQLDPGDPQTEEFVEQVMAVREADTDTTPPEKPKYRPVFLSTNAVSLSDKVQCIVRFYGDSVAIHKNFDFVHCTNYWESKTRELHFNQAALQCLLSKELRYIGSLYPLCSMIRTRKFIERGWRINAGQFLKMAMQLSELDLKNHAVLQEQLIGVDAAYFVQVLGLLRQENPETIDHAYLVKLIDRMF
jgi:hypothetical protein